MSPRQIAAAQVERMKQAAAEVWREHESEIEPERRREWRKLTWAHVIRTFHAMKVQE